MHELPMEPTALKEYQQLNSFGPMTALLLGPDILPLKDSNLATPMNSV